MSTQFKLRCDVTSTDTLTAERSDDDILFRAQNAEGEFVSLFISDEAAREFANYIRYLTKE